MRRVRDVAADERVLRPLLLLVPGDDLFDGQMPLGRDFAALSTNTSPAPSLKLTSIGPPGAARALA